MTRCALVAWVTCFISISVAAQSSTTSQQPVAQQGREPPTQRVFEVDTLATNLHVLRNGRSRSLVFVTANGTLLIDTNRAGWGPALREKVGSLTDEPVTTIVNTHSHGGHTGGNTEFPTAKEIVAHVNALATMKKLPEFSSGRGLPTRTFAEQLTIGEGAERVELSYLGRAHTDGDVWVLFPAARVLYTDVFIGKEMPIIDGVNGGSGIEYPETLAKAVTAFAGRVDRVVTGHGAMATMNDLREYVEFCREFVSAVQAGKRAGQSTAEIAKRWTLAPKYAGYTMPAPELTARNVEVIFAASK